RGLERIRRPRAAASPSSLPWRPAPTGATTAGLPVAVLKAFGPRAAAQGPTGAARRHQGRDTSNRCVLQGREAFGPLKISLAGRAGRMRAYSGMSLGREDPPLPARVATGMHAIQTQTNVMMRRKVGCST